MIVRAAVAVIGRCGLARLTHRSVAAEAGVSLAATTYYFGNRDDIIAAASECLLREYIDDYARLAQRLSISRSCTFEQVALRVVIGGVGKHRISTLAWCEIMLDFARKPSGRAMARDWFDAIFTIWKTIATATGSPQPEVETVSAVDTITGLLMIVLALGVDGTDIAAALRPDGVSLEKWATVLKPIAMPGTEARGQKRGDLTRDRIVTAAADILTESGSSELTLRKVAARAGVAPAAPSYYFPSVRGLANAALSRIFDEAKDRYRSALSLAHARPSSAEQLADLSAAIFIREATEYRSVALAGQPHRLEAARQPELRAAAWSGIDDQSRAWTRQLAASGIALTNRSGLITQSLFLGKLVRCVAIGASTADLATVRGEFAHEFHAIAEGSHWANNWYK